MEREEIRSSPFVYDDVLEIIANGVPYVPVAPTFSCWCIFLSFLSVSICGCSKSPSVTRATLYDPSARARPQVFFIPEKAASVKRLDDVLGEANLSSWCFIVVRHGGDVTGAFIVFCPSEESPQTYILSSTNTFFSMSRRLGSSLHTIGPLRHFSFSLGFSSAGVAPLPPCSHKLLDETVKTFTVFPSWLYLLDFEDNCMLSVPFSTSDLHYSCWQSGENCQVVSAGAFTLLCYAFWFSFKGGCSPFFCLVVLPTRCLLDVSRLSGLTLLLPPGFLDTREAGICAGSHAWSSFSFSSFGSAHDDMTTGSFREMFVQALMKFEGPAIT